jgi:hypothetical protein
MLLCQHLFFPFPFSIIGKLPRTEWLFHLKRVEDRSYSFHQVTQFSKWYSVEDTQASNFDCILPRDTCITSIQQYSPIYCKVNDSPTWKYWQVGSILLKVKLRSQRGIFCYRLMLLTSKLCFKCSHMSPTISIQAFFLKMNVSATWKWWLIGSIPLTAEFSFQREVMCKTIKLLTLIMLFQFIHLPLIFSRRVFTKRVSSIQHYRVLFLQMNVSPTWKQRLDREYLYDNLTQFWKGNSM